jgi:hypothetical protein
MLPLGSVISDIENIIRGHTILSGTCCSYVVFFVWGEEYLCVSRMQTQGSISLTTKIAMCSLPWIRSFFLKKWCFLIIVSLLVWCAFFKKELFSFFSSTFKLRSPLAELLVVLLHLLYQKPYRSCTHENRLWSQDQTKNSETKANQEVKAIKMWLLPSSLFCVWAACRPKDA